MTNTGVELPGFEKKWRQRLQSNSCRSKSIPTEGVSFVVSPHVVIGSGRCVDRVDVAAVRQARHCRFCPADFLDGHRQGPEDRMGAASAGALSGAPGFVALIDFAIHITVDRAKGLCASTFGVTLESGHPWFWTLIGVDQALHHLTGFGLSIFMAANG
jgi:hypothetical protein